MTNKINSSKSRTKRSDRNRDEIPRAEENSSRSAANTTKTPENSRGLIEQVSKRGYYSRNGGYGGYRGL